MSFDRIVLHMGMPKTGTSILQGAAVRFTRQANKSRFLYPSVGRQGIAHHHLAIDLLKAASEDDAAESARQFLSAATTEARVFENICFVSSEAFTNLCGIKSREKFLQFVETCDSQTPIECIIVVREMSTFLESMFLQSTRFGHMKFSFDQYLLSRQRWAADLFTTLLFFEEKLGSRFKIVMQKVDFDVLEYFEELLGLSRRALRRAARGLRPTTKRTLKEEVALAILPELETELAIAIDRRRLINQFDLEPFFSDDTRQFSMYDRDLRRRTHETYLEIARKVGFDQYVEAFGSDAGKNMTTYSLSRDLLSDADISKLKDFATVAA